MPEIKVVGLDRLRKAFAKAPVAIARSMTKAGAEAANEVLRTRGLRTYPKSTAANAPPTPYYKRGVGMQYKNFNAGNSERYGAKWNVKTRGYKTTVGNVASYAPYLAGDKSDPAGIEQAQAMKKIGWVKLKDAAAKKLPQIRRIYQAWVNRALKKAGL